MILWMFDFAIFVLLFFISFNDIWEHRIAVTLQLLLFITGILYSCFDYNNLIKHISGFIFIGFFICFLYCVMPYPMIGGGDVKLIAIIGLILGVQKAFLALFIACTMALFLNLAKRVIHKQKNAFAFAPYLSIGAFVVMRFGSHIKAWFLLHN